MNYKALNLSESSSIYETPKEVAELMVQRANIKPHDKVLEPSAGKGALLKELFKKELKLLTICEMNRENQSVLFHDLGVDVFRSDFLKLETRYLFDKILMNPPFKRDGEHILKAINHLNSNGRLVALIHLKTLSKCWRFFCSKYKNLKVQTEILSPSYFNNEFSAALLIIDKQ